MHDDQEQEQQAADDANQASRDSTVHPESKTWAAVEEDDLSTTGDGGASEGGPAR